MSTGPQSENCSDGSQESIRKMRQDRLLALILVAGLLGYAGCEYRQQVTERARLQEQAELERQRQQQETLALLREQMERDQCQQFIRSTALASGLSDREAGVQMMMLTVCSDPQSALRQRLRPQALSR